MKFLYKKSVLLDVLLFPLILASFVYRIAVTVRRYFYRKGIFTSYRAKVPVISVGNLTVGGTGKTPTVLYLCALFGDKKVAVVSRGYGSRGTGVRAVNDGSRLLCGPDACGDEPYLIARTARNAVVVVGKDRAATIRFAEANYRPDLVIMDDGFSHLAVQRDMDILLIDGTAGFGNGHLLPAGPLREPAGALRYADTVGIKNGGAPDMPELQKYDLPGRTYRFRYMLQGLRSVDDDNRREIRDIRDKKIVAIAGVAFPEDFFRLLRENGIVPDRCIALPDHHRYQETELDALVRSHAPHVVIATAKDAVKLRGIRRDRNTAWLYVDMAVEMDEKVLKDTLHRKGITA